MVMVSVTRATSPFTLRYCRDCHCPSGNSRNRLRNFASDWLIRVLQVSSTVSKPYFPIRANSRSRATLLQAIMELRSSATMSGDRTMFRKVSMTARLISPFSTRRNPGELKPSA